MTCPPIKDSQSRYDLRNLVNILCLIILYALSLWVIFLHPLEPAPWQWADDAMYFNNALSIIENFGSTPWLGKFDSLSLSKAPLFSIFLAAIHTIGLPLRLAEFLLFAPLPFLFWFAVRPIIANKWLILFSATICLLFMPIAGFESRLLRSTLFGSIALHCLICLSGTIIRIYRHKRSVWIWSMGAGLALGFAITCREEASWLMLPAALTLIIPPVISWRKIKFVSIISGVACLAVAYLVPVTTISQLNQKSYGMESPSLRQSSEFRQLYSTLCSLEPDSRQKFVPIGTETRKKVYKISPHFNKLSAILEGQAMNGIAQARAHLALNGFNLNGREFFVSNFEFALARAISLAGYDTGPKFLDFCLQATREIKSGVADDKIEAGLKGISLLPPLNLSDIPIIIGSTVKASLKILNGLTQCRYSHTAKKYSDSILAQRTQWHSVLMTWPHQIKDDNSSINTNDILFNSIITAFNASYPFLLALGFLCTIYLLVSRTEHTLPICLIVLISWSAFLGYSFTLGLVNTIAFPIISGVNSYIRMGFYPLHFLLLISTLTIYFSFTRVDQPPENRQS